MKLPKIDLKELRKLKQENFRERLKFVTEYAEWVKRTKNKRWSAEQATLISAR